jgi:hypothetical protein
MRALGLAILLAACGTNPPPGMSDDDDDMPPDFEALVSGDWTLPAGEERYFCVRATISEAIFVQAYRPIAPPGTHHTALAIDDRGGADGGFPCTAADVGMRLLFGSGVGTEPYALPDGVAIALPAGTQVILNLHLYNATDAPIAGTSGVEIKRIDAAAVQHEAEVIYALDTDLAVPPGDSSSTGRCTFRTASTVVGVFPHMHRLGTRMRASSGGEVFFDEAYSFEEQLNHATEPLAIAAGQTVDYECSFTNPTNQTIRFGDSSDDEMCVFGMYRYPAQRTGSLCSN